MKKVKRIVSTTLFFDHAVSSFSTCCAGGFTAGYDDRRINWDQLPSTAAQPKKGFDCSGFTQYVFKSFGIHLSHSSKSQAVEGTAVKKNELRKGDLVFFKTDGKGISHVGIFLGDGKFAHSSSKHGVIIDDISEAYYVKRYVTAARILSGRDLPRNHRFTRRVDSSQFPCYDQLQHIHTHMTISYTSHRARPG